MKQLQGTRTDVSPFDFALIYLRLGETERALTQHERTVKEHSSWTIYFGVEPRLDKLRGDARFVKIAICDLPRIHS